MSLEAALEEPWISQGSRAPPKGLKGSDFQYKSILALWKFIALAVGSLLLVPLQNVPQTLSELMSCGAPPP